MTDQPRSAELAERIKRRKKVIAQLQREQALEMRLLKAVKAEERRGKDAG